MRWPKKDPDPLAMRPLDVLGTAKTTVGEIASWQRGQLFQHRPHEAAIGADIADLDRDHDLLAGRARHLHVVSRAETTIGHLHHARLRVGGGSARLLRLFAVGALLLTLLALRLDFLKCFLCRLDPLAALACSPLARR